MPDYDFSTLSPHDFEILSRDLLQKHLSVTLESFKAGKDQGVDLRYCKVKDIDGFIVQCKHFHRSGLKSLLTTLKKHELPKVAKLAPSRYLLTTSVSLSRNDKSDIVKLLSPYCVSPKDVLGKEDLNNLLGTHPEVEKLHFKLWLPSTAVLERLLNSGIFTQTAIEMEEIKRRLSLFVPTPAVSSGMEMLSKTGFCMLTGIPGIGKTATARVLVAHLLRDGWEGVYVTSNASEAFQVMRSEDRQVFLYDDFLGQTSISEKLAKNEDRQLLRLMEVCRKTPQLKRLVLTTREYLFEQAKQGHELLSRSNIGLNECTVKLSDYSERTRAQILVNHLYFYGVSADVCSHFVASGTARATLTHQNYNPRIVETMCSMQHASALDRVEFSSKFIKLLDSPEAIWSHAFDNQLSSDARRILLIFALMGNYTTIDALRGEHRRLAAPLGVSLVGLEKAFKSGMEELEDNFISITPNPVSAFATFHTPAIKDFTDSRLMQEQHLLEVMLSLGAYDEVLLNAAMHFAAGPDSKENAATIVEGMKRASSHSAFKATVAERVYKLDMPLDRAEALKRWLEVIGGLEDKAATTTACLCVEGFFACLEWEKYAVSTLISLYDSWKHWGGAESLGAINLADRLIEYCCDPDDFLAVEGLLEGESGREKLLIDIKDRYPKVTDQWLDDMLESASSSQEMYGAIGAAREAAEMLGVEMDFDRFEEVASEMASGEDQRAEMYEDDYRADRFQERMESEAIDDILDSIRDGA